MSSSQRTLEPRPVIGQPEGGAGRCREWLAQHILWATCLLGVFLPGTLSSQKKPCTYPAHKQVIKFMNTNSMCLHAHLCPTPCSPMNCRLTVSSLHGISQARILEWVASSYSRASSQPWDQTCIPWSCCIGTWILYHLSHLGIICGKWKPLSRVRLFATSRTIQSTEFSRPEYESG